MITGTLLDKGSINNSPEKVQSQKKKKEDKRKSNKGRRGGMIDVEHLAEKSSIHNIVLQMDKKHS